MSSYHTSQLALTEFVRGQGELENAKAAVAIAAQKLDAATVALARLQDGVVAAFPRHTDPTLRDGSLQAEHTCRAAAKEVPPHFPQYSLQRSACSHAW